MARKRLNQWILLVLTVFLTSSPQLLIADEVFSDEEGGWHPIFLDLKNTLKVNLPVRSFIGLQFEYVTTEAQGFKFMFGEKTIDAGKFVTAPDLSVLSIEPLDNISGTFGVLSLSRYYASELAAYFAPSKEFSFRFRSVQYRREAVETLETELLAYERGNSAYEDCISDLTRASDWYVANVQKCESLHLVPIKRTLSLLLQAFNGMSRYDTLASIQRYVDENRSSVWFRLRDCADEVSMAVSDWVDDPIDELAIAPMINCTD